MRNRVKKLRKDDKLREKIRIRKRQKIPKEIRKRNDKKQARSGR